MNANAIPRPEAEDNAIWRPRVTVATIVPRDGKFLFVEESIRGQLVLNQPAGHLDPGETLLDAAVRETLEETGWHVTLDAWLGVQHWCSPEGRAFLRFTFVASARRHDDERALDAGIVRALWLSRDEIAAAGARLRSPMVLASVDDWYGGERLPLAAIRSFGALA